MVRCISFAVLVSLLHAAPATAVHYFWTNPLGGAFDEPSHWTPFAPPATQGPGGANDTTNFDLGAGLAHVKSKIDDFAVDTLVFDFDRVKSLRGHLSARAGFGNGPFAPFVEATLFHEFKGDNDLALVSGTAIDVIEGEGRGTWGRLEAGIGAQNSSAARYTPGTQTWDIANNHVANVMSGIQEDGQG